MPGETSDPSDAHDPRHELLARRPAAGEERLLAAHAGLRLPLFTLLFCAALVAVSCLETGALARWLALRLAPEWEEAALWCGRGVGAVAASGVAALLASVLLARHRAVRRDLRARTVHELRVRGARAATFTVEGSRHPLHAIEIGFGQLLVLHGPWLAHPGVFGANGVAPPFPTADFTLVRLPESGVVLGVRASGPHVAATPAGGLATPFRLRDSEVVRGALADVQGALALAAAERGRAPRDSCG